LFSYICIINKFRWHNVTEQMIYELMMRDGCDGFDNKPENKGNDIDRSNMF